MIKFVSLTTINVDKACSYVHCVAMATVHQFIIRHIGLEESEYLKESSNFVQCQKFDLSPTMKPLTLDIFILFIKNTHKSGDKLRLLKL